jgi:hypothetical protein
VGNGKVNGPLTSNHNKCKELVIDPSLPVSKVIESVERTYPKLLGSSPVLSWKPSVH